MFFPLVSEKPIGTIAFAGKEDVEINKWDFVGLKNYINIFRDGNIFKRIFTTFVFAGLAVIGQFIVGTILALLLNKSFFGRTFFRVLFVLPWLFTEVVTALLWKWLFNSIYGLFNLVLLNLNLINEPIS